MQFKLGDGDKYDLVVEFRPDSYSGDLWVIHSSDDAPEYAKGVIGYGVTIEKAIEDYVERLEDNKLSKDRWGVQHVHSAYFQKPKKIN